MTRRLLRYAKKYKKKCISPKFWASDTHEVTKELLGQFQNFRMPPQFWAPHEHEVTRGLSAAATRQTYPASKKRRTEFEQKQHFRRAAFLSAALLSNLSQQLFSAALLSSLSQRSTSSLSQQLFLSYHLFVVKGWWSAIDISLLWSRVDGQPLTSSCCGQWLAVNYEHSLWKNPRLRFREKTKPGSWKFPVQKRKPARPTTCQTPPYSYVWWKNLAPALGGITWTD